MLIRDLVEEMQQPRAAQGVESAAASRVKKGNLKKRQMKTGSAQGTKRKKVELCSMSILRLLDDVVHVFILTM